MKKYNPKTKENNTAKEPEVAYGMDINALRVKGINALMSIDNPESLESVVKKICKAAKLKWKEKVTSKEEEEETISKEEILAGIREGLIELQEARRTGRKLQTLQELIDEL